MPQPNVLQEAEETIRGLLEGADAPGAPMAAVRGAYLAAVDLRLRTQHLGLLDQQVCSAP